jgi:hypothetical protein
VVNLGELLCVNPHKRVAVRVSLFSLTHQKKNKMQTLPGANDKEKLDSLTALNHKEQAVWFLNAFWNSVGEANAEQVWSFKQKFDELDSEKVRTAAKSLVLFADSHCAQRESSSIYPSIVSKSSTKIGSSWG